MPLALLILPHALMFLELLLLAENLLQVLISVLFAAVDGNISTGDEPTS